LATARWARSGTKEATGGGVDPELGLLLTSGRERSCFLSLFSFDFARVLIFLFSRVLLCFDNSVFLHIVSSSQYIQVQ
jgi:hypothetical protein